VKAALWRIKELNLPGKKLILHFLKYFVEILYPNTLFEFFSALFVAASVRLFLSL
jgi:hypothetical protein